MQRNLFILQAMIFLATLSLLFAQVKVGPADDLQATLDNARPDSVIFVQGTHDHVVIRKPVELVGPAQIRSGAGDASALELAGSGVGRVRLRQIAAGYGIVPGDAGYVSAAISGAGFLELELFECKVRSPLILGQLAPGAPGIDAQVPTILLVDSVVTAATLRPWEETCCLPRAASGIDSPGSSVFLLRSRVRGAHALEAELPWACGLFDPAGGQGGHGIVAAMVVPYLSEVQGGAGVLWTAEGLPCSRAERGANIVIR